MRKVLFVAYQFPPCLDTGGSLRSAKFVDLLGFHGWEPTVVTLSDQPKVERIEDFQNVIRINSLTPYKKPFNLSAYGWAYNIVKKIDGLLKGGTFDLLYVSCPPFPPALATAYCKNKYSIPLVVDFRDAWTINPYKSKSAINRFLDSYLSGYMEGLVVNNCSKLILNTPSVYGAYKEKYPQLASKMMMLPNGYDERDFKDVPVLINTGDRMRMLYSGGFSSSGRNPKALLLAIKQAVMSGLKLELVLLGKQPEFLYRDVEALNLGENVSFLGQVEHTRSIEEILSADILVNFQSPSSSKIQAITGKTYEYIRSEKPILSIAPNGDNQDIIKRFARRHELIFDYSENKILLAIKQLYEEWTSGVIADDVKTRNVFQREYERRNLTSKLAKVFDEVISK